MKHDPQVFVPTASDLWCGGQTCSICGVDCSKVEAGLAEDVQVRTRTSLVGELGLLKRNERTPERSPQAVRLRRCRAAVAGLERERSKD